MPYMMGGFPDVEASARIGEAYADAGADLIELGVPYRPARRRPGHPRGRDAGARPGRHARPRAGAGARLAHACRWC